MVTEDKLPWRKLGSPPFAYNSIKTKAHFGIAVEDKILDIHRLPNVAIGEFGELGRFTVSQYNTTGR
jgi:hypothetical protein